METFNWILAEMTAVFMLLAGGMGYLVGHIRGSTWGLKHVGLLLRGRGAEDKTVYVRPPGLTQREQAAWMNAVAEVDPQSSSWQMLGIETFGCIECEKRFTHELLCIVCAADGKRSRS